MKLKTSLTDIPYAINDAQTLAELGYNLVDTNRGLEEGLLAEGTLRNWINKYGSPMPGDVYEYEFSLLLIISMHKNKFYLHSTSNPTSTFWTAL